ncbi:gliding motility-associated ABC transporter permease subunit GldF [Sanyastnella coralliicola]|uniref:gliding motility-associated ABC transporter permease subunit GldF n=1 Tax=Sanyastnella coralliicola TaxID=3069118 RepID=UPI0027B97566|nr:gliding motility-associated ABC transporter permease subunit GldF [Longitalea sp. SCSIO 12813]
MLALLKKEIRSFLSSLIGYVVIAVFLLLVSLFMWIFPGQWNTLDVGLSNLDTLFFIAPWVFMFLIPAITMRSFSEEKRTGTIELLLTRPLSDMQIVLAKYLGGVMLVLISLLPTLVYFLTVHFIGNPVGNVDSGGTWGSYIGLLLLGSAYVSIGIFTSAITPNQIVSFLVSALICFFMFIGFESLGSFDLFGPLDDTVIALGMNDHYKSLSRGLVDSRDVVYFGILTALFLFASRTVLQSRRW